MGGYNGVDECESCRTWKVQLFGQRKTQERCSSKMKPRLRAEWMVLRGQFYILASCCLSPIRINSVLEELRVSRLAVIDEEICLKHLEVGDARVKIRWIERKEKLCVVCIQV